MKEEHHIVKIQKPLMTTDPDRPWRVYDENRDHDQTIPESQIPKRIKKHMKYISKTYYHAVWTDLGWLFNEPAKEKTW